VRDKGFLLRNLELQALTHVHTLTKFPILGSIATILLPQDLRPSLNFVWLSVMMVRPRVVLSYAPSHVTWKNLCSTVPYKQM
jgi:hypothetical protein